MHTVCQKHSLTVAQNEVHKCVCIASLVLSALVVVAAFVIDSYATGVSGVYILHRIAAPHLGLREW